MLFFNDVIRAGNKCTLQLTLVLVEWYSGPWRDILIFLPCLQIMRDRLMSDWVSLSAYLFIVCVNACTFHCSFSAFLFCHATICSSRNACFHCHSVLQSALIYCGTDFLFTALPGVTGLPPGLRDPAELVPPLLATPGDARDFVPVVPPVAREDPEADVLVPVPVPVRVPVFEVPVPEFVIEERRRPVVFDSSSLTSLPTIKLFVSTKFIIHSGISPFFDFCLGFFSCFGDAWGLGDSLELPVDEEVIWSAHVEGGVGVPGPKNWKKNTTKRNLTCSY